jgi:hypothetical protein
LTQGERCGGVRVSPVLSLGSSLPGMTNKLGEKYRLKKYEKILKKFLSRDLIRL